VLEWVNIKLIFIVQTNEHLLTFITAATMVQFNTLHWHLAGCDEENEKCQTNVKKSKHPHFISNNVFSENRTIYEIMWKNIVEPDRPQMTI